MKKITLLSGIITLLFLTSCKLPDGPTYHMPQEFKDYVMFPVGSYWIYEDSISGIIDSVYLITQNTFIAEPDNFSNYEALEQTFYFSYWDTVVNGGGGLVNFSDKDTVIYTYNYGKGYYISSSEVGYTISSQEYYLSYYDSLKVKGIWYKNIKCIYSYNKLNYWAENIGLIKAEIPDSINWQLKKYYINN